MKDEYEEEMYALLKVMDQVLSKSSRRKSDQQHYAWFYVNIRDLLERNRNQ